MKTNIIEAGIDPGIGGLVQTAILNKKGFKWITQATIEAQDGSILVTKRNNESWKQIKNGHLIGKTEKSLEKDLL
ncbi:MAG: hypothetical protein NWF07_08665, partial [Candidatus Bathyarchaeota archaeon]|nr:hypothetical protein [Candidatus Bathyarchaeota archaeon]